MGGGFGSKNDAGDYTFIAIELARRTGRPVHCALTRREDNVIAGNRNATIQRLTIGATQRRHDHGARRRVRERRRLARLVVAGRRADDDALRVPQREDDGYGAKLNLPPMKAFRAPGVRRGHVRPREPARRARGEARPRPARGAPPEPHPARPDRRPAVQQQEPARVLPPRGAALGAPARGARALDRHRQARGRDGLADLVRRRRPALVRVDPRRLGRARDRRDRDAGHRHRVAHRDGDDRRGGARHPAGARHGLAGRLGPRPVRLDLGGLVDDPVDGAGGARGRRGREAADPRDRRPAPRPGRRERR